MPNSASAWTHTELDEWFADEMDGGELLDDRFQVGRPDDTVVSGDGVVLRRLNRDFGDPDLDQFITAWNAAWENVWGVGWHDLDPAKRTGLGSAPTVLEAWQGLALESKAALRRGWERQQQRITDEQKSQEWAEAESIIPELAGDAFGRTSGEGPSAGGEGTEGTEVEGGADVEAPSGAPPTSRPSWFVWALGAAGFIVVLIVLVALVSGGDDAPPTGEAPPDAAGAETDEVPDPVDDAPDVADPAGDTVNFADGEPLAGRDAADIRGASLEDERLLVHMSQALGQVLDPDENFSSAVRIQLLREDRSLIRQWLVENHDGTRTEEVQDAETGEPVEGEALEVAEQGEALAFVMGASVLTEAYFFGIEAFNTPVDGDALGYDNMLVSVAELLAAADQRNGAADDGG